MNKVTKKAVLAASLTLALVGTAFAQSNQDGQAANDRELDRLSRQRLLEHPHNFGTPVPQSSIPPEKITPLKGLWVCRSSDPFHPIYAAPNTRAPIIGRTLSWVAVGGADVGKFARVLSYSDKVGYIQRRFVHPFHNKVAPGSTCTVLGVQPNGLLAFDLRG